MSNSRHTPGPWASDGRPNKKGRAKINAPNWGNFAQVVVEMKGGHPSEEGLANLDVILAAPMLLAALLAALEAMKAQPAMQGREYTALGIQINNALFYAGHGA